MSNETTLKINGEGNASEVIDKAANSMKLFQIGYDLVKEGLSKGIEIVKDSLKEYEDFEKTQVQIAAVLKSTNDVSGQSTESIEKLSLSLANNSNFSADAETAAQLVELQFDKIGKETFPAAAQAANDLAARTGMDLSGAMEIVGRSMEKPENAARSLRAANIILTDSQNTQINSLAKAGETAKEQALVLGILESHYGGAAAAARDTFAGALAHVENQTKELEKATGHLGAVIGRDFVENIGKSEQKLTEYLSSAKGLDQLGNVAAVIAGSITVIKDVFGPLADILKSSIKTITDTGNNLKTLGDKTSTAAAGFDILKGASIVIGEAMTVVSGVIAIFINYYVDLINDIKASASVIQDVFAGNWKKAAEDVKKVGDDLKKTGSDIVGGVEDIVKKTGETFKKMDKAIDLTKVQKDTESAMEKTKAKIVNAYSTAGKEAGAGLVQPLEKAFNLLEFLNSDMFKNIEKGTNAVLSSTKSMMDQYYSNALSSAQGDAQKTKELKEQQFNLNKATSAVTSVINTSQAITGALTVPPPFGEILAGIVGAEGAIQTGLILAQQMPAFAGGGVTAGGYALVGENGPEIRKDPAGTRYFSNSDSKKMLGGDKHFHFHGNIIANDPIEFYRKTAILAQRMELGRS